MEKNPGVRVLPTIGNETIYLLTLLRLGLPTIIYVCDHCDGNLSAGQMCSTTFMSGGKPYSCTRRVGHEGNCMACGIHKEEHPVVSWKKEEAITPEQAVESLLKVSDNMTGQASDITSMLMSFVGLFVVLHKNDDKSFRKLERCYPPKGCKIQARVFLHNGDMVEIRASDNGKPLFFVKQKDKAVVGIRDPEYMGDAVYREEVTVVSDEQEGE